jgi:hypothetical protein
MLDPPHSTQEEAGCTMESLVQAVNFTMVLLNSDLIALNRMISKMK